MICLWVNHLQREMDADVRRSVPGNTDATVRVEDDGLCSSGNGGCAVRRERVDGQFELRDIRHLRPLLWEGSMRMRSRSSSMSKIVRCQSAGSFEKKQKVRRRHRHLILLGQSRTRL